MDKTEAKERVEQIRLKMRDCETAHFMEDELYTEFIRHVANGDFGELSEVAKIVLEAEKIDFERWYT